MTRINIAQAKAELSDLVDRALRGEEIVIARRDRPLVRLVAVDQERRGMQLGALAGRITLSDDFDAPLDDFAAYR
ncbi:MAG: type II toxin-antitoxin system prevent-host-death family antitoxin [Myxococcota bacterium]